MSWSFKILRVAGIDVKIHATFFLILLFWGWSGYHEGGFPAAAESVVFVLLLFLCVVLHEFGHSLMARRFGIRTPDITLLPIGGVARLERSPETARQEFLISLAGPSVNIIIALVLVPFALDFSDSAQTIFRAEGMHWWAAQMLYANLFLMVFNLIPAFPMDGGRVFRAGLEMFMPRLRATTIAARVGQVFAIAFVIVAFLYFNSIFLALIGIFVFVGAGQELRGVRFMETTGRRRVGDVMITRFDTISQHLSHEQIVAFARSHGQSAFPIVDGSMRVTGMVSRDDILNPASLASSLGIVRPVPAITPETSAILALQTMQASGEPILPVVNHSGQIVGMVTAAALTEQ